MKLKKKLVAITSAIMVVVSMMGITSFALSETCSGNPQTYIKTKSDKYLLSGAYPGWTTSQATTLGKKSGYNNSLKVSAYADYKLVNGEYKELFTDINYSTNKTVMTSLNHDVSSSAVRRRHASALYYASNISSGTVNTIVITVNKPK